jgi:hypothetical protein
MIQNFFKKVVDGNGKWLLKTPLKDVDRREISSLYEMMKSEVLVIQQAIQEGAKNLTDTSPSSPSLATKLETAALVHVCSPSLPSITLTFSTDPIKMVAPLL